MLARKLLFIPPRFAALAAVVLSSCIVGPAQAAVTSIGSVNPVPPVGGGTFSSNLVVGDDQAASADTRAWLNIDGGTTLQYNTLIVGDEEEFVGIVNVLGNFLGGVNTSFNLSSQGSTSAPTVQIGNEGTGYLNVLGGSMALTSTFSDMSIGEEPTGIGYVTVSDPFTQFSLSEDLYVGRAGMGSLEVLNGATFQTTSASSAHLVTIGAEATGIGTMVVDGLGSVFRAGHSLVVGDDGVGNLTIGHQAIVDVDNVTSAIVSVGTLGRMTLDGGILIGQTPTTGFGTTVFGIVEGGGLVRGSVGFNASGTLEVGPGDLMQFSGDVSNQGSALIDNGELRFLAGFTNNAQGVLPAPGRISLEDGTVRFAEPLTNAGVVSSAHGTNNVHGEITNTGTIVVASETVATFHDAVTNSGGTITVLPRGNALFLADVIFTSAALLELGVGLDGTTDTSAQLGVAGSVSLGGSLTVNVHGGFTPTLGQSFDLITSDSGISGTFGSVTVPNIPGMLEYRIIYDPTTVRMVVADETMATLPGDFNGDFAVDAADYVVWRNGLGTIFTQDDYDDWRANFGRTFGSGAGSTAASASNGAVPEPESALLLVFGLLVGGRMLCWNREKNHDPRAFSGFTEASTTRAPRPRLV